MKFDIDVKVDVPVPKVDAGAAAGAAAELAGAAQKLAGSAAGVAGAVVGAVGAGLAIGAAVKSSAAVAPSGGFKVDAHANVAALSDESLGLPDEAEESPMEPHVVLDSVLDPVDYPFSL